MKRQILGLLLTASVTAILGCQLIPSNPKTQSSANADVKAPMVWNTDFVPGRVYELKQPVSVIQYHTGIGIDLMILKLEGGQYPAVFGAPNTVQEYLRVGPQSRRWKNVKAVLKPGTLIRYEETRLHNGGPVLGTKGLPVGRLVADEFSDIGLFEMGYLGTNAYYNHRAEGYLAQNVDPEYLKPADEILLETRPSDDPDADAPISWCTNFVPGRVYELQRRVVVLREKTRRGTEYLIKHRHPLTSAVAEPSLLEEYHRGGTKARKWRNVIALLEPGTLIRYEQTRSYHGGPITMDSLGVPIGRLVADEYSHLEPIEMSNISRCTDYARPGAVAFDNDPYFLKPVEE